MTIRFINSVPQKGNTCARTITESRVIGKAQNPLPTVKICAPRPDNRNNGKTKFL